MPGAGWVPGSQSGTSAVGVGSGESISRSVDQVRVGLLTRPFLAEDEAAPQSARRSILISTYLALEFEHAKRHLLVEARRRAGISQAELSRRSGVAPSVASTLVVYEPVEVVAAGRGRS
jgi:hypothetical protein